MMSAFSFVTWLSESGIHEKIPKDSCLPLRQTHESIHHTKGMICECIPRAVCILKNFSAFWDSYSQRPISLSCKNSGRIGG